MRTFLHTVPWHLILIVFGLLPSTLLTWPTSLLIDSIDESSAESEEPQPAPEFELIAAVPEITVVTEAPDSESAVDSSTDQEGTGTQTNSLSVTTGTYEGSVADGSQPKNVDDEGSSPTNTDYPDANNSLASSIIPDETDNVKNKSIPSFITMFDSIKYDSQKHLIAEKLKTVDYKDVCGQPAFASSRIVGGTDAPYGQWPWQISLEEAGDAGFEHICGAALLNTNWAITAAHCVQGSEPDLVRLVLGEYNLRNTNENYEHIERRLQLIVVHSEYDSKTYDNDLALLRFSEPVTFQPNIIPICIPEDDYNFLNNTGYVSGWGRLYEDGPLPDVMQYVPVPIIPNKKCEEMYALAGYPEYIPHTFICAGYEIGGRDSCEGDSGGPLVIVYKSRWRLAGVISWGIGCAERNQPGIYVRVSEFREWINKIIAF